MYVRWWRLIDLSFVETALRKELSCTYVLMYNNRDIARAIERVHTAAVRNVSTTEYSGSIVVSCYTRTEHQA